MKKGHKILAAAFILLFAGAFFGSGVLKSDIPPLLERSYIVVNKNMTVGVCCKDGGFVCVEENCLDPNEPD